MVVGGRYGTGVLVALGVNVGVRVGVLVQVDGSVRVGVLVRVNVAVSEGGKDTVAVGVAVASFPPPELQEVSSITARSRIPTFFTA